MGGARSETWVTLFLFGKVGLERRPIMPWNEVTTVTLRAEFVRLAWMPIQKKKPNKMANTHNDTSILTTLVFDFTPRSSRGDSVRLPEYEPQPLAPQPGDDRPCRIETGRDEQGLVGTLLIPHHDVRLGHLHLGGGIHEVLEQMPRLGLFVAPADTAGQQAVQAADHQRQLQVAVDLHRHD